MGAVEAKTYTICGDMNYFSPEQLAHRGHDETVDFWALGVFLYEMVTGDYPFVAKNEIATYSKIATFAADPTSRRPIRGVSRARRCLPASWCPDRIRGLRRCPEAIVA